MLTTERLLIRPFQKSDYIDLNEYLSRKEIYRFERGGPITLKIAKQYARDWAKGKNFFAATLKENNKLIGHVSFFPERSPVFKTWQIGFIFHPDYQNKGYATEASQVIIKYAFSDLGAHRVVAYCSPDNTPSWKVLEKCGMKREGILKKDFILRDDENVKPVWLDSYIYAILDEDIV
jgi:RimJ/RimL family protein N-acetyltransferase